MLKRLLLLVALALTQVSCGIEYGENLSPLKLWDLTEGQRSRLEREKREFLKIEDLEVGKGAVAAWGRRWEAEIKVHYADDGTLVYQGPIVAYIGFDGLHASDFHDRFMLTDSQPGIRLGLNGMAVGGKRRITVAPELVCEGNQKGCYVLVVEPGFVNEFPVAKKTLIVEATLTESCAPVRLRIRPGGTLTLVDITVWCRDKSLPKVGGADWHIY